MYEVREILSMKIFQIKIIKSVIIKGKENQRKLKQKNMNWKITEKTITDASHTIEKKKEMYMDVKLNSLDCGGNGKK